MTVAADTRIPLVDLGAQFETIREELLAATEAVMRRSAFIQGPFVAAFEGEFAAYTGAPHCIGISSGTDAIFLALKALGRSWSTSTRATT